MRVFVSVHVSRHHLFYFSYVLLTIDASAAAAATAVRYIIFIFAKSFVSSKNAYLIHKIYSFSVYAANTHVHSYRFDYVYTYYTYINGFIFFQMPLSVYFIGGSLLFYFVV